MTRVYLLEGRVECSAGNQTVQVSAGEMAELTADGGIIVKAFTEQDIPSFVQDEVDPDLIDGLDEAPSSYDSEPSESPSTPDAIGGEGEAYYEPDSGTLDLPRPNYRNMIEVNESGHLLLESGIINGLVVFSDDSTFTMTGGTFNYLVSLTQNASFTMNSGTINSVDETAVAVSMDSTFIMNGGEIVSSGYKETIHLYNNGHAELNGGRITKNGNYVIAAPSPDETSIIIGDTVIRSTGKSFFTSGGTNWWPDGYTSTPEPDEEGCYYLVKQ